VAISVLNCLKTAFYPFLPFSSQKLHEYLGYSGNVQDAGWNFTRPSAGQNLVAPQPLFTKLDEKIIEEENNRLEHTQTE
jgi:methionyl-tRNA synthetase